MVWYWWLIVNTLLHKSQFLWFLLNCAFFCIAGNFFRCPLEKISSAMKLNIFLVYIFVLHFVLPKVLQIKMSEVC